MRAPAFALVTLMLAACQSGTATPTSTVAVNARSAPPPSAGGPREGSLAGPARTSAPIAACPASGPIFTVLPMDPADFRSFRPLGFPQPPIHIFGAKHSAFTINLPGATPVSGRRVRFPSDATVTDITSTESTAGSGYQLSFAPCRDLKSYLFHLGSISPALETAFKASVPRCQDFDFGAAGGKVKKCDAKLALAVKAGDLVGGSDAFAGVDWGLVDYRVDLPYANLKRYDGDYPHIVSPVDYSAPDVRGQLVAKLGNMDGTLRRTVAPVAGTVMQDLPGTAQGNWFTPGGANFMNTTNFEPFLGLLHDHVEPAIPIMSMGTSVKGVRLGLYTFTPQSTGTVNRDFADVRPDGKTYCYERFGSGQTRSGLNLGAIDGVLLMTMPTATTLRVERRAGATCANAPPMGPDAFTFER